YPASPVVAGLPGTELTIEEVWERAEGKQPGGQQRQPERTNHLTKGYLCPFRLIVADGIAVYTGKGKTLVAITFRDGRTLLDHRTCDPATGDNCYVNLCGCYDDRDCPSGVGYVLATVDVLVQLSAGTPPKPPATSPRRCRSARSVRREPPKGTIASAQPFETPRVPTAPSRIGSTPRQKPSSIRQGGAP
ncbi:MAG: hypothetical protein H6Q86_2233, partial [candidate division NC10 bacterium]|nr:hypothetical protein [candidate division NC10 bacterium]